MVGVEYMNDDPAEVDVLYGKVHVKDGPEVLQQIADGVVHCFSSAGLYYFCSTLHLYKPFLFLS
jgi:activating signal cointegrator complex subunit 1